MEQGDRAELPGLVEAQSQRMACTSSEIRVPMVILNSSSNRPLSTLNSSGAELFWAPGSPALSFS
jgi:hypothetical protein